jgi:hypothetical protein
MIWDGQLVDGFFLRTQGLPFMFVIKHDHIS